MNQAYNKNFIFKAHSFEEYANGVCTRKGSVDTTIVAKVLNGSLLSTKIL